MTKSVLFTTCSRLSCACATLPTVIICVDDSDLLNHDICVRFTLEGTLKKSWKDPDGCGNVNWRYLIDYDENDLADPTTALTSAEITGVFCKGCITTWVEDEINCIGSGGVCVADTDTIDFFLNEGCVSGDVNISADAGNIISAHSDGIFAEASAQSADWHILGNAGTVDGTNFAGTTDAVSWDVRVNNERGFRIQLGSGSNTMSPIGGPSTNTITASDNAVIGGGDSNEISGGGFDSILGGEFNSIASDAVDSANIVVGGIFNTISGVGSVRNFIGGGGGLAGANNTIEGGAQDGCQNSVVVGGSNNHVRNGSGFSSVIGGLDNIIDFASYGIIGGGQSNNILESDSSFVGGGTSNSINTGLLDVVVGGINNQILSNGSEFLYSNIIGGGEENLITYNESSGIFSGFGNQIDFSATVSGDVGGYASFIGGGTDNQILSANVPNHSAGFGLQNVIGGGAGNEIKNSDDNFIGGGNGQFVDGSFGGATLSGNLISTAHVLCGGTNNKILTDNTVPDDNTVYGYNAIGGGKDNRILNGYYSAIPGGLFLRLGKSSFGYQGFSSSIGSTATDLTALSNLAYFGEVDLWIGNRDSVARKLKLFEPNASATYTGTNFTSFRAQAQSANIDYITPAAAGVAAQVMTISGVSGTDVTLTFSDPSTLGNIITTTTTPYAALSTDYTILIDATAGNKTVTLPAAASNTKRIYNIKKIDSSGNTVTIDANGAETIDGALTQILSVQWASLQIQCNGTSWFII